MVLIVCLSGLIIGTYTDLKTREVPDWVNYSLIFGGFGLALIRSILASNIFILMYSAIGFGLFFIIAWIMYYSGQWGGGDSKMIMGLGALIGITWPLNGIPFLVDFLIYTIIFGAAYGFIWSLVLAIKNLRRFTKEYANRLKSTTRIKILLLVGTIAILASSFFMGRELRIVSLLVAVIIIVTFYLFVFIKSVEKVCMIKQINPDKLTLGDWIAKEIKHGKKVIAGPGDLGIEKHQLEQILALYKKGLIKKVVVREGIPFVPSFLMAFLVTEFVGISLFSFMI